MARQFALVALIGMVGGGISTSALFGEDDPDPGFVAILDRFAETRKEPDAEVAPQLEKYAQEFLEYAKKHADRPEAVDALAWIILNGFRLSPRAEAIGTLKTRYVEHPRLANVFSPYGEARFAVDLQELAELALEKNQSPEVRRRVCLKLGDVSTAHSDVPGGDAYYGRALREFQDVETAIHVLRQSQGAARLEALNALLQAHRDAPKFRRAFLAIAMDASNNNRARFFDANVELFNHAHTHTDDRVVQAIAFLGLARLAAWLGDKAQLFPYMDERTRTETWRIFMGNTLQKVKMASSADQYKQAGEHYVRAIEALKAGRLEDLEAERFEFVYEMLTTSTRREVTALGRFGQLLAGPRKELHELIPGQALPELIGRDLDGQMFRVANPPGKVVVLTFLQPSGGLCSDVLTPLENVQDTLGDRGTVICISGDGFALTRKFARDYDYKHPIVVDGTESSTPGQKPGPLFSAWNITACPTVYVIDAKGTIQRRFLGWPGSEGLIQATKEVNESN